MAEARIDLLDPPDFIVQLSTDEILSELAADADIANLSASDPAGRVVHGWAVREQKRRSQENENAKRLILAFAKGSDLDYISATYYRKSDGSHIVRKPNESDDDFRLAIQESPEGLTSAGTLKSYNFHASRAHELLNRNTVNSHSPEPMVMNTYFILEDDERADEVQQAIEHYLVDFIPGGDLFSAIRAVKNTGDISVTIKVRGGVVLDLVKAQGSKALLEYKENAKRINGIISFSSISDALTVPGVVQIPFPEGWEDIVCSVNEYPVLDSVTLIYEVV